ncbi:MAG TPA: tRNA pseudouridine(55) synthase TruB [Candidatus Binatus sp.]|uniref:tRNA pseudouridine(55) synthase TruB n=1 Tax=Candidatus Binatus sp. TaxID=2811406 RepID=UPI002B49E8EA|nr:tRNA pseudouridine(55) synthase TruB [Candidatus Binatus sp.]HKN12741.1 tRNA pseudouridine(55) synthase TruB [Candidatus Binatus sp.]
MNAILLVDKPAGISSAEVVRRVKSRVKPARVGHLGTLDPFATGLLPIMIGEATKLAPFIDGGDKEYAGLIRLGVETDTLDRDGAEVRRAEVPAISAEKLARVSAQFTGAIEQVPPVYSAIKRAGVPLYRLARRGDDVAPPEKRSVKIKRLDLVCGAPDTIRFVTTCSPGTYARSLARDIGIALGTVAHLDELRRTRNGAFSIADATPLADILAALDSGAPLARLISLREALVGFPELVVDTTAEKRLRNGDSRALDSQVPPNGPLFKVISQGGELIAVARATSRVTAIVERIFNPPD